MCGTSIVAMRRSRPGESLTSLSRENGVIRPRRCAQGSAGERGDLGANVGTVGAARLEQAATRYFPGGNEVRFRLLDGLWRWGCAA